MKSLSRSRRMLVGAGLVVLGLWAAALGSIQLRDGSDAASPASVVVVPDAPVAVAFQAPERRVVLPIGAEQVDEYPMRFPHTPEGAAAAAVSLTRYSASLDYVVVDEVLRLYAMSTDAAAEAADQAAAVAVSAGRARLGLPMSGPSPLDASVFAEPFGIRWTAKGKDRVIVSVLSAVEYRSGQRELRELVAANTEWRWDARVGDWRVAPGDAGRAPAAAEIGSAEFNDAGWTALAERRS
ncbi:MAG: hypothetical protein ACT4QG_01530 [Sporichthyaceae bacterium]